MADAAGNSITSFFTIWTEPRATMRRIVDTDPTRNVVALAAIGPGISALAGQWSKALGSNANLSVLWPLWVAASVVVQAAIGVLFLFIFGAIFKWSGSLLGGVASRVEVRAALAWSQVPAIAAELILLLAVLTGVPIPTPTTPGTLPADRSCVLQSPGRRGSARRLGILRLAEVYRRGASILGVARAGCGPNTAAHRTARHRVHRFCRSAV